MILVTGGLGFIGAEVARALLDLGESVVVTQRSRPVPDFLDGRVAVAKVDLTDRAAVLALGDRYDITGLVHLGGVPPAPDDVLGAFRANSDALFNVFEAARRGGVRRVSVASAIGVYVGVEATPWREDAPITAVAPYPIEAAKKSGEVLGTYFAAAGLFEVVNLRIGAVWGPRGRATSRFFAVPEMVNAAVAGGRPAEPPFADDGVDLIYVRDCGQAIARLQTAEKLRFPTYNIGGGRSVTNREVAAAVRRVLPGADIPLRDGRGPHGGTPDQYLDVTRLREDTGFEPAFGLARGMPEYVASLQSTAPSTRD
jgi:UDP-glucose 4-epimerase